MEATGAAESIAEQRVPLQSTADAALLPCADKDAQPTRRDITQQTRVWCPESRDSVDPQVSHILRVIPQQPREADFGDLCRGPAMSTIAQSEFAPVSAPTVQNLADAVKGSPADAPEVRSRPRRKTALAAKDFLAKLVDPKGYSNQKALMSIQADSCTRTPADAMDNQGQDNTRHGSENGTAHPKELQTASLTANRLPVAARSPQTAAVSDATALPEKSRSLRQPGTAATKGFLGAASDSTTASRLAAAGVTLSARSNASTKMQEPPSSNEVPAQDILLGCPKCRYAKNGCGACRVTPAMTRDKQLRWQPDAGRPQTEIPSAAVFHPTEEEFRDPLAYINSCRPEGERCGIVCIVPPPSFDPPFALEKGTNGQSAESFRFAIRKQLTSHLCMRLPNKQSGKQATKRGYGATTHAEGDTDDEFGFVTLDKRHTLRSFAAYADWVKGVHFDNQSLPQADVSLQSEKRRKLHTYTGHAPSVDEIEAEFWRIVETPDAVYESLYGQDLDSGHHGSGFPLPPFRAALLRAHLATLEHGKSKSAAAVAKDAHANVSAESTEDVRPEDTEAHYSTHPWNINNLPRHKGSTLRYLAGDELITGVQVPWLYVGSALSAFCWHVEDHALYSVNYHHLGDPKVWYGVPAHASEALEEAIRDALPHLVDPTPNLLYQLVTMVSPKQLKARGVPVYRLVHEEKSFVVTFPNAFHSGFNTGFNCAEAVNFGPPDWLPYGTDRAEKYRKDWKPLTLSHDALLVTLVTSAGVEAPAVAASTADIPPAASPQQPKAAKAAQQDAAHDIQVEIGVSPKPGTTEGKKEQSEQVYQACSAALRTRADRQPGSQPEDVPQVLESHSASSPSARSQAPSGTAAGVSNDRGHAADVEAPAETASSGVAGEIAQYPHGVVGTDALVGGHLGALDPVHMYDVPLEGIRLAAGELTLRAIEERRRIAAGSADGSLSVQMMSGTPGAKDSQGRHTDTTDVDCELCKTDLWLSAVVSASTPGRAVCPEHASELSGPPTKRVLLCRYTPRDLDMMVRGAVKQVPGAREAVGFAKKRHKLWEARRPKVKKIGPMAKLHVTQLGEEVLAADAFAAGGPMPPAHRPSLQVIDGSCFDDADDDAECDSEADDIPEAMFDSGAIPATDTADLHDYEPDLEGDDASEDEDESRSRTTRGTQNGGRKDRKRRSAEDSQRLKRKYTRRKTVPARQTGSTPPSMVPSSPTNRTYHVVSDTANEAVAAATQQQVSEAPCPSSAAASTASAMGSQQGPQPEGSAPSLTVKPQRKPSRRRPDPAAAEAGALCPDGVRRVHKPCKKLSGTDYEVELPLLKKQKQETEMLDPASTAAHCVPPAPKICSQGIACSKEPAHSTAPQVQPATVVSQQQTPSCHTVPHDMHLPQPVMLHPPSAMMRQAAQMQRMLPPHCSMESSAASDIHMRSSPVSTAVRDALAQQARMMSTSESPSPSSLSWSGLGIFAGSPSQPLQPRAQIIQTSAAQSPSRRQQFANRHSLVERYLRPPVASLPQQPPYSAQLASAHHPPGSAMAAAMQSTDNLPDHSVPLVTLPHLPQQQQHHMDSLQRIQQEPQSREGQHLQLLSGKPGALCRNSDTKQLNFQCTPEDRRSHSSCQ